MIVDKRPIVDNVVGSNWIVGFDEVATSFRR